jgi:hypothetical protein
MPELESLLERLTRARVEFVVVGGFAAVAHGVTLLTEDIDICCRLGPENLLRIQASLADLHPVHRLTPFANSRLSGNVRKRIGPDRPQPMCNTRIVLPQPCLTNHSYPRN